MSTSNDSPSVVAKVPRVLLVWPIFHSVLPHAFLNFSRLLLTAAQHCPQYRFDPFVVPRASIHTAMNMAVDVALANGHEYLIAFDDDCLPEIIDYPPGDNRRWQVIPRMLALAGMGHPILSGVGYMRGYPHTTTVGRLYPWGTSLVIDEDVQGGNFKGFYWLDDIDSHLDECDPNGLLSCDFCGVPIICIHRSVLETLPKPLFETKDEGGGSSTHDIHFCNKAREAGFSIKVDTHIDCSHIVEAPMINRTSRKVAREVQQFGVDRIKKKVDALLQEKELVNG